MAADYQTSHPWESRIEAYLLEWSLSLVTTCEILTKALEIDVGRQSRGDEMQVAECLKRLGWQQSRKQHLGKRRRVWVKAAQPAMPAGQPSSQAESVEVDRGSNVETKSTSADKGQPGQPETIHSFDQNASGEQGQLPNWDKAYPHHIRPSTGILTEQQFE